MGRNKRKNQNKENNRPDAYSTITPENADLEDYYRVQKICPTEEEYQQFMESLKTTLPSSFRISSSSEFAPEVKMVLKEIHLPALENIEIEGTKIEPPRLLPFYPDELAYQYSATRNQIRSCEELKTFHRFLVEETELGNMSRQEAVSMVPPLLLDLHPTHSVLDMCASPGSKTAQILEMMHANTPKGEITNGLVIANDVDLERAYTLVHQVKRVGSQCVLVTNQDAAHFPVIKVERNGAEQALLYDRILADVPCSGDGTLRKNPLLWTRWGVNIGHGLHTTQRLILARALQLVKVGGKVVYSTCSLNPIENEAVVANVLAQYKDSVRLADTSASLPGLKRNGGLTTWKVRSKGGKWFDKYDEVPEELQRSLRISMFPPTDEEVISQMHNCLRILPHQQNTGAFFVAVFEKFAPITKNDTTAEIAELTEPTDDVVQPEAPPKKKPRFARNEEPFIMLDQDAIEVTEFARHYGLSDEFPRDQFLVRTEDGTRRALFFVSKVVKEILSCHSNEKLKLVNTGIRSIAKNTLSTKKTGDPESEETIATYCPYRVHHEFIGVVLPFVSEKRILEFSKQDLLKALTEEFPLVHTFTESLAAKLKDVTYGGFLIRFIGATAYLQKDLVISAWRARTSINCLINATERAALIKKLDLIHDTVSK